MALYFIPIQIVVFSRLPLLLEGRMAKKMVKLYILFYYFLVMSVWLGLGVNARYWVYHNIVFYDFF
jgi:LytS/YehU family sensor histidine kinase